LIQLNEPSLSATGTRRSCHRGHFDLDKGARRKIGADTGAPRPTVIHSHQIASISALRAHGAPANRSADRYRSIVSFVLVMCFGLTLVLIFPEIALWLPNQYYGK